MLKIMEKGNMNSLGSSPVEGNGGGKVIMWEDTVHVGAITSALESVENFLPQLEHYYLDLARELGVPVVEGSGSDLEGVWRELKEGRCTREDALAILIGAWVLGMRKRAEDGNARLEELVGVLDNMGMKKAADALRLISIHCPLPESGAGVEEMAVGGVAVGTLPSSVEEVINIADLDQENGADINVRNKKQESPLHKAAENWGQWASATGTSSSLGIIRYLVENAEDIYAKDMDGNTFLHCLLRDQTITPEQFHGLAEFLLEKKYGQLFQAQNDDHVTPLHLAVRNMEVMRSTLELLHEKGIDFNLPDKQGNVLLYYAVRGRRSSELLSNLVDLGADLNQKCFGGRRSLLHTAIMWDNVEALRFFVQEKGMNVNVVDWEGNTPLQCAVKGDDELMLEFVEILRKSAADKTVKDKDGQSPYEVVLKNKYVTDKNRVLDWLRE